MFSDLLFYYAMLHNLQGYKSGISHLPAASVTLVGSSQTSSTPSSVKIKSPISVFQTSFTSSANKVGQDGQVLEYEDVHSENGPRASSHAQPVSSSIHHNSQLLAHEAAGRDCCPLRKSISNSDCQNFGFIGF